MFDKFIGGMNGALVCADESQVGGYTGVSKYSTFTNCMNLGTIAHLSHYYYMNVRWDRLKELEEEKYKLNSAQIEWLTSGSANNIFGLAKVISLMMPDSFDSHMWSTVSKEFLKQHGLRWLSYL